MSKIHAIGGVCDAEFYHSHVDSRVYQMSELKVAEPEAASRNLIVDIAELTEKGNIKYKLVSRVSRVV